MWRSKIHNCIARTLHRHYNFPCWFFTAERIYCYYFYNFFDFPIELQNISSRSKSFWGTQFIDGTEYEEEEFSVRGNRRPNCGGIVPLVICGLSAYGFSSCYCCSAEFGILSNRTWKKKHWNFYFIKEKTPLFCVDHIRANIRSIESQLSCTN